jgi:hypothetical protein
MMNAELSHRLAWYLNYVVAASGSLDEDERSRIIKIAEEAQTFQALPDDLKSKIMTAELEFSEEEYPFIPIPWPLRNQ